MNAKTQKLPPGGGPIKGPEGEPQKDAGSVPDGGGANAMWGARLAAGPAAVMERINAHIGFDRRLYAQDLAGSKAHCDMLVRKGIIASEDGAATLAGTARVLAERTGGGRVGQGSERTS